MNSVVVLVTLKFLSILFLGDAADPTEDKIIGGTQIEIENAPYQIALENTGGQYCGGAMIGPHCAITAAHCCEPWKNEPINIRLGTNLRNQGGTVIKVRKMIIHSQYIPMEDDFDICVLKLDRLSVKTYDVSCVKIASKCTPELLPNTNLTVTGWGHTAFGGPASDILLAVDIPSITSTHCQQMYGENAVISENMFCALYPQGGRDSCQGDSGGPAVSNNILYGIVSWGVDCDNLLFPGVYTNVSRFSEWIIRRCRCSIY